MPFADLPNAAGLISKVHTIYAVFMPPESLEAECFGEHALLMYFHRKVQQKRIINLCMSPVTNPPDQTAMTTIQHPVYVPSTLDAVVPLYLVPCVCCRYFVTFKNP